MDDHLEGFSNGSHDFMYYEDFDYGEFERGERGYDQREALHILSVVVYIVAFVLGVLGNGLVIWVTAFKTKRTVNSVWLLNLAIADFVFVLFLPVSIDYVLQDFHWRFGQAVCKLNSFASVTNMYASVLFLTVLSVDRYVSLVHPSWARRTRTVERAWSVCVGVWGVALLLSCPSLLFRETIELRHEVVCYNNFDGPHVHFAMVTVRTVVGFLVPFAAISASGALIVLRVRRSGAARMSSFSRTVLAVVLAFFLCWAPFHVFSVMELTVHSSTRLHAVLQTGFPLATSLAFFNSCVNPVLYVLLGTKARRIVRRSCLDLTKRSLRELSQSISGTQSMSVPGSGATEEPPAHTCV
ncbi:G-protein coupled receptor 1-like [Anguilla anguilla]|uniref:G-protein coupled receptor 1-like n=1 Tax=Anguilla anguilla TaxID=7936 RepID=UPI0015A7A17F|nr:G-protein coupled receptor 1-like [Anguilla anguilla]XP_035250560.1 G-protein coupled receptor 1-like [Anguilla anguilla]